MSDNSFVMKQLTRSGQNIRISGDLILKGEPTQQIVVEIQPSKPGDPKPKFKYPPEIIMPRPGDLRWILPPRNSPIYDETKGYAQAGGYPTVEHEDFTYPGR
jgi:hypothetical protein